jgi:Domain of unknown function (DUF4145)
MPAITCPHCGAYANFRENTSFNSNVRNRGPVHFFTWTCNACGGPILGESGAHGEPTNYHPRSVSRREFPDVPAAIAADSSEAFACHSIDAWKAATAMARRALQAAAYEQGAHKRSIVKQIDWMAEQGKITPQLAEVAHRIRLGGNLGAHPQEPNGEEYDGLAEVTREDSAAVLTFLENFFQYVYVIPKSLEKL